MCGDTTMPTDTVDWKSLEFTCVPEADRLPKPDPKVDAWFQQANAMSKAGLKKDGDSWAMQGTALPSSIFFEKNMPEALAALRTAAKLGTCKAFSSYKKPLPTVISVRR